MFEVSSHRTNTSSKFFAPLINSHVDIRLKWPSFFDSQCTLYNNKKNCSLSQC